MLSKDLGPLPYGHTSFSPATIFCPFDENKSGVTAKKNFLISDNTNSYVNNCAMLFCLQPNFSPGEDVQNYSKECEAAVNEQINLELQASYVLLSMSCNKYHDVVVDDATQSGFNDFLLIQSDICVSLAHMLMEYQRDCGGQIELRDIKKPERDTWGTMLEACEAALELAKNIEDSLLALRRVARKNDDRHMIGFISDNLLIKQAESVCELSSFLTKLKKAGEGYGVN